MPAYHCPFCPCVFYSEEDLRDHMIKYGWKAEEHKRKWLEDNKYLKYKDLS